MNICMFENTKHSIAQSPLILKVTPFATPSIFNRHGKIYCLLIHRRRKQNCAPSKGANQLRKTMKFADHSDFAVCIRPASKVSPEGSAHRAETPLARHVTWHARKCHFGRNRNGSSSTTTAPTYLFQCGLVGICVNSFKMLHNLLEVDSFGQEKLRPIDTPFVNIVIEMSRSTNRQAPDQNLPVRDIG